MPTGIPIVGRPTATVDAAKAYARKRNAGRLADVFRYADELWRLGSKVGYDPAVVFAQFCEETNTGTSRPWVERLNPCGLGILEPGGRPIHDLGIGFDNPEDAARAHLVHLSAYVKGYDPKLKAYIGLDPRYHAVFAADYAGQAKDLDYLAGRWAANPNYAEQIAGHLERIRTAIGTPGPTPAEAGNAPLPENIVMHETGNFHERTFGQQPVAIVYHVTDQRDFNKVKNWFQNPEGASAHAVIERDGTIHQFVSSTRAAWTNGDFYLWDDPRGDPNCNANPNRPFTTVHRRDIPWLVEATLKCCPHVKQAGMNFNDFTLSIEHMGKPADGFTEAQYRSTIALSAYWRDRYGLTIDRGHCLRHADIDSKERSYCPGDLFDLKRVITALGGDHTKLD